MVIRATDQYISEILMLLKVDTFLKVAVICASGTDISPFSELFCCDGWRK